MSFIRTLGESVSQIFVCNEGKKKQAGGEGELRTTAETLYHVFSGTGERERV